jgi:hypothetical protein
MATNKPKSKPSGTDSVSKKQSFQEWAAAGGGVPLQYKGREHVWDRKVKQYAEGGSVDMAGGGIAKLAKGLAKGVEQPVRKPPIAVPIVEAIQAPSVIIPSKVGRVKEAVRQSKGDYGVRRVERAADEIPNLERLYKEDALRRAFTGDNATAMMTMNPRDFEKYAAPLDPRFMDESSFRYTRSGERITYPEYMKNYLPNVGPFESVPFLEINKKRQGTTQIPFISGHEGRHRSRVMSDRGDEAGLVQLLPRAELYKPFPRRSQEDYIEALRKELEMTGNLVKPEASPNQSNSPKRRAIDLPDVYAAGGDVHMDKGGAAFGVFPQMKPRRAKQDREAAKNVPVDLARGFVSGVLGAPGDIESLLRIPYDYLRSPTMSELVTQDKTSKTFLPTSEDIEKRLPFKSDTPVSRAATGLGQIGGGFYMGPGSPLRVVGALPGAIRHGAKEFAKASAAGAPRVIKPKGGNWMTGSVDSMTGTVEKALDPLKTRLAQAAGQNHVPGQGVSFREMREQEALEQWIDRNLTNYVKKEMATPEDPVRRLAEQGILHFEPQGGAARARANRTVAGMPADPTSTSPLARAWEDVADTAVVGSPYQDFVLFGESMDKGLRRVGGEFAVKNPEATVYAINDIGSTTSNLGFDHIMDVMRQDVASGRIRPEQLSKVSMEQAVRRTYDYDQEMAKKMREAQIKATEGMPVYKEYPEGYKWIELAKSKDALPEGFSILPDVTNYKNPGNELYTMFDDKGNAVSTGASEAEAMRLYKRKEREADLESALKYEGETMGHCVGGYCPDVISGRSRIYSLRDAKGEPHVTVETKPGSLDPGMWYDTQPKAVQDAMNAAGFSGYNIRHSPQFKEAQASAPPAIQQIKGKQNRAPNEQYLPFVQDFVKGSNWSGVGDLPNTGLFKIQSGPRATEFDKAAFERYGNYATSQELDELEKILKAQPPEGMKAGGPVKMAGGGAMKEVLKKLLKPSGETIAQELTAAERAAAGRKAAELIKSQPPVKASEALGQAMEKGFKKTTTTQADRTRVGGGNIGGAPFSAISEVDPAYAGKVWGVMDEGTAARLKNLTDPETAWTTMLGSANQLKTNPIVFDKLKKGFLESMKAGNLSPELEAKINQNLGVILGEGSVIRDPKIWRQVDTFEKRAAVADLIMGQGLPPKKGGSALGGEKSGKGVIFKPTDTLIRETEPYLLHPEHGGNAPTFAAGPRLFSMDPVSEFRPDLHPGFPTLISGKDLGYNMIPTPTEVYLPDWHKAFKQKKPERFQGPWAEDILQRRKDGGYKLKGAEGPGYYDLALGLEGEGLPSQALNDAYIRHLIREGFKAGGAVSGLSTVNKLCGCHD